MDGESFFENLYNNTQNADCIEIPLDIFLKIILELGECKGRVLALRDLADERGGTPSASDLLAISGVKMREKPNA